MSQNPRRFVASTDLEVPGLEAIMEYGDASKVKRDRIPGAMPINDHSNVNRVRLTQMDGLHDDPEGAETRQPNPDRHGERAGNMLYRGRTIGLTGRVEAGSVGAMRNAWRRFRGQFGDTERDLLVHHPYEVGALVNEVPNPSLALDGWGWSTASAGGGTLGDVVGGVTDGILKVGSATVTGATADGNLRADVYESTESFPEFLAEWNGEDVWVSIRAKVQAASGTVTSMGVGLRQWTYEGETLVGSTVLTGFVDSVSSPAVGTWQTFEARVPATSIRALATHLSLYLRLNFSTAGTYTMRFFNAACVLIPFEIPTPSAYFDGDTSGFSWRGVSKRSRSIGPTHAVNKIQDPRFEKIVSGSAQQLSQWGVLGSTTVATYTLPSRSSRWSGEHVEGSLYTLGTKIATSAAQVGVVGLDDAGRNYYPVHEGRLYRWRARLNLLQRPAGATFNLAITWLREDGGVISTQTSEDIPIGESDAMVVKEAPPKAVAAHVLAHTIGSTAAGSVLEFFLSDPCFVDITDWDPGDFYGVGDEAEETGNHRRIPRPFLLQKVRKSPGDLKAPEQQTRSRAWRDFTMSLRSADPRIYVLDPRRKSYEMPSIAAMKIAMQNASTFVEDPLDIVASDTFIGHAVGGVLNGEPAQLGGTWATAGDAGDWAYATYNLVRSASSGSSTAGRRGILGTTPYVNHTVSAQVFVDGYPLAAGQINRAGVIARYNSSGNFVSYITATESVSIDSTNPNIEVRSLVVTQYLNNVPTTLGSQVFARIDTTGAYTTPLYQVSLEVQSTGRVIAQLRDTGASKTLLATVSVTSSAAATGGALQTGLPGIFDMRTATGTSARWIRNFVVTTPATAPVPTGATYSGQNLPIGVGWTRQAAQPSFNQGDAAFGGVTFMTWPSGTIVERPSAPILARFYNNSYTYTEPRVIAGCSPVVRSKIGVGVGYARSLYEGTGTYTAKWYSNEATVLVKWVNSTTWLELRWKAISHGKMLATSLPAGVAQTATSAQPWAFELWCSHNTSGTLATTRLATWDYTSVPTTSLLNVPFDPASAKAYLDVALVDNAVLWALWVNGYPTPLNARLTSTHRIEGGSYALPGALATVIGSTVAGRAGFAMKVDNPPAFDQGKVLWNETIYNQPFVHYVRISNAEDNAPTLEIPVIGDVDTSPEIVLTGLLTNPVISLQIPREDGTMDSESISLEGTIAADEKIYIGNGKIVDDTGANRYGMLVPGTRLPTLRPGINYATLSATDWDEALAENMSVTWRDALR